MGLHIQESNFGIIQSFIFSKMTLIIEDILMILSVILMVIVVDTGNWQTVFRIYYRYCLNVQINTTKPN